MPDIIQDVHKVKKPSKSGTTLKLVKIQNVVCPKQLYATVDVRSCKVLCKWYAGQSEIYVFCNYLSQNLKG